MGILLSDGSDLIGITRVLDIKYIRILRSCLRLIGAWPGKSLGEDEPKYYTYGKGYVFIIMLVCLPPGILYILNNVGIIEFFELSHTYITVLITLFATTHIFIHKVSHFFTLYVNIMMGIGLILFNVAPIYKNISSGAYTNYKTQNVTFELSVYYELPLDYKHNFKHYWIIFTFNWIISVFCSFCFCTLDLLMSLMVFHVYGHLRILINCIENFRRPAQKRRFNNIEYEWFSEQEIELILVDIRNIALHHNLVLRFIDKMNGTFGPIIALYYFFNLISGCVLLLQCSQMNAEALTRYGTLTFIVFSELIQISIVFELIGIMGEKLSKAVYSIPWECMNVSGGKMVFIILINTQKSLNIRALDMVDIGVQTMTTIIKASMSYFLMLRTFAEN